MADPMKLKRLRDWSDDAVWISFGIMLTLWVTVIVWVVMPP